MAIVINGSGTVTGLSVGGLPDGTVDAGTLANNAAGTDKLATDIAMLGFYRASDHSKAKYNLVDQVIDDYNDATGIDAGNSTNEALTSGAYSGSTAQIIDAYTTDTRGTAKTGTHTGRRTGNAEILVVAGGGSGSGNQGRGGYSAGGGGGGGVVHHATYPIVADVVYDWTVGEGGASSGNSGDNGGNSVWNINSEGSQSTMTANGGGRGGYNGQNGAQGGSGGGGGKTANGENFNQTSNGGGTGYGHEGGNSASGGGDGSGGGGGAGANGVQASGDTGGVGGAGKLFSTFVAYGTTSGNVASTGSNGGYFAGGGGGGSTTSTAVAGGVGGGSVGGHGGTQPGECINDTGGGSGGAGTDQSNRAGDGIILIAYPPLAQDLTLQSVATTAESAPTKGDIVILIEDASGTATINTDIKAYISRNGSAFSSALTLVDEGDWGTNKRILAAHNVDISGITSGTSMKYKITTHNQSTSKETKIHGTSLAWA